MRPSFTADEVKTIQNARHKLKVAAAEKVDIVLPQNEMDLLQRYNDLKNYQERDEIIFEEKAAKAGATLEQQKRARRIQEINAMELPYVPDPNASVPPDPEFKVMDMAVMNQINSRLQALEYQLEKLIEVWKDPADDV